MKLSIGIVAVVTAVPDDFERPEICDPLSENYVNCWKPHGHFGHKNGTAGFVQLNKGGECGFQYRGDSMTNATCSFVQPTIDGFTFDWGNAAFVAKGKNNNGDVVGLDFSGDVNIVGKWYVEFDQTQEFNDALDKYVGELEYADYMGDNYTEELTPEGFSWEDPAVDCGMNGDDVFGFTPPECKYNADGYYSEYAIMITNQHAGDPNNNYAIANYGGKDNVFTVTLGGPCYEHPPTPHDANQAEITLSNKDDCTFMVKVLKGQAQLFYFQGTLDEGVVDFWDVIIA